LAGIGGKVILKEFDGGHLGFFTNMKAEVTDVVQKRLVSLK
jgi:hypothetical protein